MEAAKLELNKRARKWYCWPVERQGSCYRTTRHHGKAISFRSKGPVRLMVEMKHSDKFKEDLELGWKHWHGKVSGIPKLSAS
jgi:hypothetical protein